MDYPERIRNEAELEELLAVPQTALIEMMKRLDGDIMILGIAGKMGVTMGRLAVNAIRAAGVNRKVIGVARFSRPEDRAKLESWGIETIACDLLDRESVNRLPQVRNVIFMAGRALLFSSPIVANPLKNIITVSKRQIVLDMR